MKRLLPSLMAMAIIFLGKIPSAQAQCPTIGGLPDTISVCKNTIVPLNALLVTGAGSAIALDTTWTPATGLSNANINNPQATVGTNSVLYTITIPAITPYNSVLNGNFSSGNTGFTSNYTVPTPPYGTWGQLSYEGTYAITTNPNLVHSNFSGFPDHTGDGANLMMVINGASAANTSIWCQTITVAPNTDYDFSAWGASTTPSSPAVLQFSINGTLIGTPLSLPGATGVWTEFHAVWNSGSNTTATICIVDQQTATSGNDFALDDISFRQICTVKDSVYIKVTNLTPAVSHQMDAGCMADTVLLTALTGAGDVPAQATWDFGDGLTGNGVSVTHVYPVQGTYTIRLLTQKDGCADSAQISINTLHPIAAAFDIDKDTICAGETVSFTSNSIVSGPGTYLFEFGDGSSSASTTASHTYTLPGVYQVMHVIRDTIPCSDTAYQTLIVLPAEQAIISTSSLSLGCEADTLTLNALPGSTPGQITWYFGDGSSDTGNTVTHVYATQGSYTIKLTAGTGFCADTAQTTINTLHPLLADFSMDQDTICIGETVAFTSNSTVSGPGTYLFYFGDGDSSHSPTPAHVYTQAGVFTVRHVVQDSIPCSDTAIKTIVVMPGAPPTFSISDSVICKGEKIRFASDAVPGWDSLQWNFGDGTVLSGMDSTWHSFEISGDRNVTLFLNYPYCSSYLISRNISVMEQPVIALGSDTSMCPGQEAMVLLPTVTGSASLLWSDGSTGASLRVTQPGAYWVSATVAPGCTATDTILIRKDCYLDIPNIFTPNGDGINDYFLPRQLLSSGLVGFRMQIFNRWGELVFETSNVDGRGWDGTTNGKAQPQGVYVYQITALLKDATQAKYVGNVTLLR